MEADEEYQFGHGANIKIKIWHQIQHYSQITSVSHLSIPDGAFGTGPALFVFENTTGIVNLTLRMNKVRFSFKVWCFDKVSFVTETKNKTTKKPSYSNIAKHWCGFIAQHWLFPEILNLEIRDRYGWVCNAYKK